MGTIEIIVGFISLGLLLFLTIFELRISSRKPKKVEEQTIKISENFEKKNDKREDDMNEEEIVAVISAAMMAYSSDKIVKKERSKSKAIDEKCSNRWLAHSPQIFWKPRKE